MSVMAREGAAVTRDAYARIESLIAAQRCVVLDGGTGAMLIDVAGERPEVEEHLWGLTAAHDSPERVLGVHRAYVEVGADVITTNTWGLPTALHRAPPRVWSEAVPVHWMDLARSGVRLARDAVAAGGRGGEVAVAFSLNGDVDRPEGLETVRLLDRALETEPPDLILLETLTEIRGSTYATVEALVASGRPLWLSFRRCRHGACGIYGEHGGEPDADAFGRAVRRFEDLGVRAILINCIPPDHIQGMVSWLRDYTDLPLGVYPNVGSLSVAGWRGAAAVGAEEYARLALAWRREGAQIVGGCCGTTPEHISAAAAILADTAPGRERPAPISKEATAPRAAARWTDSRGRQLHPLDFPQMVTEARVEPPDAAGMMVWKHLYRESIGAHQRCLDVGCGSGVLAVQLARNGAMHVHAIDANPEAVVNTMTTAFRNGVADRVSAATADLYPWIPLERYDVVVADLQRISPDPCGALAGAAADPWDRSLLDRLFTMLPEALADDGVAFVTQLSVVGESRTSQLLDTLALRSRVLDYSFLDLGALGEAARERLARVEGRSDAYHLALGAPVAVAYLLEITRA